MALKIIVVFVCIVLFKATLNIYNYFTLKRYQRIYFDWHKNHIVPFPRYAEQTVKLLENAGLKDGAMSITEYHLGQPYLHSGVSIFKSICSGNGSIVHEICLCFEKALGVYRTRIFESFNPIFWINLIVFAPKHLLNYFGADMEKSTSKALNVILTFIWWLITISFSIFKEDIFTIIISFLQKIKEYM